MHEGNQEVNAVLTVRHAVHEKGESMCKRDKRCIICYEKKKTTTTEERMNDSKTRKPETRNTISCCMGSEGRKYHPHLQPLPSFRLHSCRCPPLTACSQAAHHPLLSFTLTCRLECREKTSLSSAIQVISMSWRESRRRKWPFCMQSFRL